MSKLSPRALGGFFFDAEHEGQWSIEWLRFSFNGNSCVLEGAIEPDPSAWFNQGL
jgi:hypothetical protein